MDSAVARAIAATTVIMKTAIVRIISTGAIIIASRSLPAQEQLGLRVSDLAGIQSAWINPTGTLLHPATWEINLAGAGFHLHNTYAGLQGTNARKLLRSLPDYLNASGSEEPAAAPVPVFREAAHRHYLSFLSYAEGPACSVRLGALQAFGFFTRGQARISSHDIPGAYSYQPYTQRPLNDPFPVKPFQGAAAGWTEIGLNYAWKRPLRNGYAGFGTNLRFLTGYVAGYLQSFQPFAHNKTEAYRIALDHAHGRFGYASSYLDGSSQAMASTGSGFATDIGFHRLFDRLRWAESFRIGVSLLDLGSIRFHRHAFAHQVYSAEPIGLHMADYEHFRHPRELPQVIRLFSRDVSGDSLASLRAAQFNLVLPAAASLQASVVLPGNLQVQVLFVNRLSSGRIALQRNNLVALLPRFDTRWFSLALPVSWYNFDHIRTGLSLRMGPITIGTDHLGAWTGTRRPTYGTDIYAAFQWSHFFLRRHAPGLLSSARCRDRIRCYRF
ncbi:MAG: hypothetical protein RLY31_1880 [Bacteroidota bacterium]|jgi:hypothetical protein